MATNKIQRRPPITKKSSSSPSHTARNARETIESVVVAFVLAFLFRTFEAEAFVIPTGSMAPTLMGMHKDVHCEQCGNRYQASASHEQDERVEKKRAELAHAQSTGRHPGEVQRLEAQVASYQIVATTCPMCRWTQTVAPLQPDEIGDRFRHDLDSKEKSYSGDRIIVSKLAYTFAPPERWDVVVFRYPGEAQQAYIKRMIGLPGETIRLFGGDVFVERPGAKADSGSERDGFDIARKPPHKLRAMMHVVHDTDYFPQQLHDAGWPFRWSTWQTIKGQTGKGPTTGGDGKNTFKSEYVVEQDGDVTNLQQKFSVDSQSKSPTWIRYRHLVPDYSDWQSILANGGQADRTPTPQLITDFYAYNTDVLRHHMSTQRGLQSRNSKLGLHWVGDLLLAAEVEVKSARGHLLLDLVEAGKHFRCSVNLSNGQATLSINGLKKFTAKATTPLSEPGTYDILFSNVDDRLMLWVDGDVIDFGGDDDGGAPYDAVVLFGGRQQIMPQSTDVDMGDLAPLGVGARQADLVIHNLKVLRDIYYIADRHDRQWGREITDLGKEIFELLMGHDNDVRPAFEGESMTKFLSDAEYWDWFATRRSHEFKLKDDDQDQFDQFFVLGDNSPSSKDSRLWKEPEQNGYNVDVKEPGGHYVERKLLTGKALFVYWPHSWGRIPGIGIPLPFFPNFGDMRLVR